LRRTLFALMFIVVLLTLFSIQTTFGYENTEHGFSIDPPEGWSIEELTGVIAVQFTENVVDGSSVNVAVEETQSSLSQVISSTKLALATAFENYTVVSEGSRVVNGVDGYELVATFKYEGRILKAKQVYFVEEGKKFVITCTAIDLLYENSLVDFETSISSFRITDSQQKVPLDKYNGDNTILIIVVIAAAVAAIIITAVFLLRKKSKGLENQSQTTIYEEPKTVDFVRLC
jgi:hypothetical protein